ncbi:uncharacterized protein LOC113846527 isoform X2 [Abrus precatorius]|uniref:Uncharacterized protein LOC113846527 isoform X2 n=1 Tax=Abrus precatorius TaxID=3816 RepID=A0A8B8JGY9_ABRPR|nr:uncharacterized protein LOC113846527 isoform X2 [Abrus precatorius]
MALPANRDHTPKSDSTNPCCEQWKKKYLKAQELRNALRQAVNVLELKINEIQAQKNKASVVKAETQEKLEEVNSRVPLENENCSFKSQIANHSTQKEHGSNDRDGDENEKLRGLLADGEKEIGRMKELLDVEKRRADSESKKAAEAYKLLEKEKNKTADKGETARIEGEKAEEYRIQVARLEKQVNETKTKLASEMSKFKEATKKFETEKRKILAEKRNAELGMAKANENFEVEKCKILAEKRNAELAMAKAIENLEVEKRKADEEKRRADAEMVKLEQQKALAEDNWNKFMKEKHLANQMSQQVEEDKRMIEDLKQKIDELSSLKKPIEMTADVNVKAGGSKVKLLKNKLKLEKLRAKHARQKYKLEASRFSVLQHELGRLKVDFIQLVHRLDILDASFSPVAGSIHDQTKSQNILDMQNSNVTRQVCHLNLSQMHGQFENEFLDPCCTTTDTRDPLRKNMQHTPLLGLSSGNYSQSITGIDSKLGPLVRGSNRTKLQSSAVNSSTESFSDRQLMGSQETTTFPVSASAPLTQEIFNARQSICNPYDRSVTVHHLKRKRIHDAVEYIANLSSEKLSDLHGLLYRKFGKCLEGERDVLPNLNNLHVKDNRAHKKRKKSHREKVDMIPWVNRDEKRGIDEANNEVYNDANAYRRTSCPASYTLETTQACGERTCDAANNLDSIISFDTVNGGSYMKLLELENATNEECYRRVMDCPLSPSLPEIEFHETCAADNLINPFLEESLQEDMLSSRTDLFPSPFFDVLRVEINSNEQKFDVSGVPYSLQNRSTQAKKAEVANLPHMHTPEDSRTASLMEDGVGSLHNQLPEFCVVFSNIKDNSTISRILVATKSCIARCNLATQTGWAVSNILTALKVEDKLSQKENVSVLLTLLLFNFTVTTTKTFGKLWDGSFFDCLKSYSEHICTVLSRPETRNLFVENYPLHEFLGLIEDFLIEGKVIVKNRLDAETWSDCDLRANDFRDCVNEVSSDVASNEQLLAGSVILASVCAATDHVGFVCEASYEILRLCKWDSLMVLTILHIFAYLGGEKFFDLDNFGLVMTVLKSLVMSLEHGSLSDGTACLPSINQLHTEFCMNVKCPFLEGAESVDVVACLLLEEIKNCWPQGIKRVDLSDSRFMSDTYNAGHCFNQEAAQCAVKKNCDVPCYLKKCVISASPPDALNNVAFCHLSDVLSLVELVANRMNWHWTDVKLVPQLLNILDSCVEENFAIAIIVLLGQLGRIGIDVGGYEDQGVGNLRCSLFSYLCCTTSMNAGLSLQIATATALFGLLPVDLNALLHTNINFPAFSKSVSDNAETLRKWFSGLDKDQQKLLSDILKRTGVYNK